jgi:hypothetical protein
VPAVLLGLIVAVTPTGAPSDCERDRSRESTAARDDDLRFRHRRPARRYSTRH